MMKRHPLNDTFHWRNHDGPRRLVSDEQARAYDELGYFILEDAFDAERAAAVAELIDPFEARMTQFLRTQNDGKLFIAQADAITFTVHLAAQCPELREFVSDPVFQGLTHDLIGPDVRLYWDQAVYKKPEPDREFPWHQDNGYTFIEPQDYLTCWVALTDAHADNGCPWVVSRRHHEGTLEHTMTDLGWQCLEKPEDAEPLPVRAGSIAVFSSLTPHRTGPNRTEDVRKSYIVQYAPSGAMRIDLDSSGNRQETPQDTPERQFEILRNGQPVG